MSNARSLIAELSRLSVIRMAFKPILLKGGIPDSRCEHCPAAGDGDVVHG